MVDDETGDNISQIKFEARVLSEVVWVMALWMCVVLAWIIVAHVYLRACV